MSTPEPERLLRTRRRSDPPARLCLLCLPYAGGGVTIYHAWQTMLPSDVEVRAAQLPGRQDRLLDPPFQSIDSILTALLQALHAQPLPPLVLFGHSLGALVAFELSRCLRALKKPPLALIVSGCRAPHLPSPAGIVYNLPDAAFKDALHRIYATPSAVLQDAALMELVLPALRADFKVHDTYCYQQGEPLELPVTVLHGRNDSTVSCTEAAAWSELCTRPAVLHECDGGHLFVDTHRAWVVERVAEVLRGCTSSSLADGE